MRRSNQNLVTITLLVIACALVARFVGEERAVAPRSSATPSSVGTSTALPTSSPEPLWSLPPIDRSVPWRPGLHAPAMIGPSERVELAGPTAVPVAAADAPVPESGVAYWLKIREGARVRKVSLGLTDRWGRCAGQWTCRSYPLPHDTTVTVGLAGSTECGRETLGVEGVKLGRPFPLPSFVSLASDERLWGRTEVDRLKELSDFGYWHADDYAIKGAFVNSDCLVVLVAWYQCPRPNHRFNRYCLVILTPTSTTWNVEVIRNEVADFDGDATFLAFRESFLILDGHDTLWFDAQGRPLARVPWPWHAHHTFLREAEYEAGMMIVRFSNRDLHPFVVCSDPRSGRALGEFNIGPSGAPTR